MFRTMTRTMTLAGSMILSLALLSGCPSKESKWEGTYKSAKEGMTIKRLPDHKGTLESAGNSGEITWEIAADDKIVVHAMIPIGMFRTSEGDLRDEEGTVWKKQ